MDQAKVYGKVKWFDPERGYGFLTSDADAAHPRGRHVFVHYSDILGDGYKSLERGQPVAFHITRNEKGLNAEAVELVDEQ